MNSLTSCWLLTQDLARKLRFLVVWPGERPTNHSRAWQDVFVISMLGGKCGGQYFEFGARGPVHESNTWLLSSSFGWRGVSIDTDPGKLKAWREVRPRDLFLLADAGEIDFRKALSMWFDDAHGRVDFLQLSVDSGYKNMQLLERLLKCNWRFSVIIFKTAVQSKNMNSRETSRQLLLANGYRLVGADICNLAPAESSAQMTVEDWWVDPAAISAGTVQELDQIGRISGLPQKLLFLE